jgi:hypothetical protein
MCVLPERRVGSLLWGEHSEYATSFEVVLLR